MDFFNKFNKLDNKNFKSNIYKILTISAFAILFITMGSSYAYLTYSDNSSLTNTVTSGNLELNLDNESSTISLSKAIPITDEMALESDSEYSFTLKNTGDVLTHYEIYLNSVCSTTSTYTVNNESITPDMCLESKYINVGVSINGGDYFIINFDDDKATIDMGEIWPEEQINYVIKIWLDVDTPNSYNDASKNILFVSKLSLVGEQRTSRETLYSAIKDSVQTMNINYKYINDANKVVYKIIDNITEEQTSKCETYFLEDQGWWNGNQDEIGDVCSGGTDIYNYTLQMYIDYENFNDSQLAYLEEIGIITRTGVVYNVGDNGVFLYDGTDDNNGSYPIYYYRGNVTNNNVLFANMCWKIVRTTSTGGTKIVYNGLPTDGTCNNTGEASQLTNLSAFNFDNLSPAEAGYMYGERYDFSTKNTSSLSGTIIYGNDVTYSNGIYTLKDTMESTDSGTDANTIASRYHYTCFNSTGTCSEVYYGTYFGETVISYLTFKNGVTLETAITKMQTNTNDSTIKTAIDTWYSNNLTNYTKYLENTIFCNDRTYTYGAMYSKDSNATTYSYYKPATNISNGTPSLVCSNINDRFSLSTSYGGTTGYGNNALKYSVGLLTSDEVILAGGQYTDNSNYYLYTGEDYWLLSPYYWWHHYARSLITLSSGFLIDTNLGIEAGIRPTISLRLGTTFTSGTGEPDSPYIIS